MAIDEKKQSAAESLQKARTYGMVRCHNPSCMDRIAPRPGDRTVKCPNCGMEYRLFWVTPQLPRIRGPVWEVNRKLVDDAISSKEGS